MTTIAFAGKPVCDWEDRAAREDLVGELASDAYVCLGLLDAGRSIST